MKSRPILLIAAMTFVAALVITLQLAAQDETAQAKKPKHHHYQLIDMGTFGGPNSYIIPAPGIGSHNQINPPGAAVGGAGTPILRTLTSNPFICGGLDGVVAFVNHALQWQDGVVTDLGSLEGPDNCSNATSINAQGQIAGQSENGIIDPVLGFNEIRAVLWKNGTIADLGTLGGNESAAAGVNSRGQVVGFAVNNTPDPFSIVYFQLGGVSNGTQTRAFLWDEMNGIQDLGTLGTGNDAWSNYVNDAGQVAGFSYTDTTPNPVTGVPTTHPFLWEKGKGMTDLGSLGGTLAGSEVANFQGGLNNRGQVVGGSTLAGDLVFHPFLWTKPGPMQDLGTLGGDCGTAMAINDAGMVVGAANYTPGTCSGDLNHAFMWSRKRGIIDLGTVDGDGCSTAVEINSSGQIVGTSAACDFSVVHAVLWEDGHIIDLNTLIPPNSPLSLTDAFAINDRGEIAGVGLPPGCADERYCGHAFLLIPCDEDHPGIQGCDYSMVDASAVPGVSSAPAIPAATNANQIPGFRGAANPMLRRFGRGLGPWNRGMGTQQPSPTPISSSPSSATPAEPALGDWVAADSLITPYWTRGHPGSCVLDDTTGQLLLNGECWKYQYPFCTIKPSSNCHKGQTATRSTSAFCGGLSSTMVDPTKPCY